MYDPAEARRRMVENQLKPSRITDERLLEAMAEVPRELFVPAALRSVAYVDEDIDIGGGRSLIEPLALAKLLQAAALRREDVVLMLGCSTGYAAAVVARLAASVILLLPEGEKAPPSDALMAEVGAENVVTQYSDPRCGLPSQAPFDVILILGAVRSVPQALLDQLAEGGRLVAVVSGARAGEVTVFQRVGSAIGRRVVADARVPEVPALRPEPAFTL